MTTYAERLATALHAGAVASMGNCGSHGESYDDHMAWHEGQAQAILAADPSLAATEAVERLLPYARHAFGCALGRGSRCDCGYPEAAEAARATLSEPRDHASEYGRLLAERDRLIAAGADPADLIIPDPPLSEPREGTER